VSIDLKEEDYIRFSLYLINLMEKRIINTDSVIVPSAGLVELYKTHIAYLKQYPSRKALYEINQSKTKTP
jgi:hypothetical protein